MSYVQYVKTRNTGQIAGDKNYTAELLRLYTTVKVLHAIQGAERSSLHTSPLFSIGMQ